MPTPEERNRIVSSFVKEPIHQLTDQQLLLNQLRPICDRVESQLKEIIKANGFIRDPKALAELAAKMYIEHLHKWSKDDLLLLYCSGLAFNSVDRARL